MVALKIYTHTVYFMQQQQHTRNKTHSLTLQSEATKNRKERERERAKRKKKIELYSQERSQIESSLNGIQIPTSVSCRHWQRIYIAKKTRNFFIYRTPA